MVEQMDFYINLEVVAFAKKYYLQILIYDSAKEGLIEIKFISIS